MSGTSSPWHGRVDGAGPDHLRWHQHVRVADAGPGTQSEAPGVAPEAAPGEGRLGALLSPGPGGTGGIALVGFASDEGVRRNHGRPGAASGPGALRSALAPLAVHEAGPVTDLGDVLVVHHDLESAQVALGARIARAYDTHGLVVVLGGGHETAWGSYLGRAAAGRFAGKRVGVVNLDAHFDLREADRATSGTPFRQMAEADAEAGRDFRYLVAGISRASNTRVLFDTAERLGAEVVVDRDCLPSRLSELLERIDTFAAAVDVVHLSIDLDVLPAATAPGVSAPAAYGVPMEVVDAVCAHVAVSGKLVLLDVVELCPPYDVDSRTARAAARLIHTVAEAWQPVAQHTFTPGPAPAPAAPHPLRRRSQ